MSFEIRIVQDRVEVRQGREKLAAVPLEGFLSQIVQASDRSADCEILPRCVRVWRERGDATAVVLEVPRHARTVRWVASGEGRPFGPKARYETRFLAFPYIILLLVFRRGQLTGFQQLYYRRKPLDSSAASQQELLLPNLLNVAKGYGQRCWVCLQNLEIRASQPWSKKIDAIIDHVFNAAFNRSSEVHEGNSYWGSIGRVDPRLESVEAWERASKQNPLFVLDVPWTSAGTTVGAELQSMLDQVLSVPSLGTATELAGLITRIGKQEKRR